jgi:hypothetical protein
MPLQIRRGTNTERQSMSQPLAAGELIYVTDTQQLYIGTGTTLGGIPVTGYTDENAQDAAAALFVNGAHTGISFTYDDVDDTINAVVDLGTTYTDENAQDAAAALFVNGAHTGISFTYNDVDNTIEAVVDVSGPITEDIIPDVSETYDIGSPAFKFKDLYLSGNSLFLGDATITSTGTAINLPAGSTVGGVEISGQGIGVVEGETYNINIRADDSTILVNSQTGQLSTFGLNIVDSKIESNTGFIDVGSLDSFQTVEMYQEPNGNFLNLYGITNGESPWVGFNISRTSISDPVAVEAEDLLSGLLFFGFDGEEYTRAVAITGRVNSGSTVSPGSVPGELLVIVRGEADQDQTMTFNASGVLNAPILKPGVYDNAAARDSFITNPQPGMMVYLANDGTNNPAFYGYHGTPTNSWVKLTP